jgi:RHS repeat-associated protein
VLATYTYGADNARLLTNEGGLRTYYAWSGASVISEYIESGTQTSLQWTKSYIYLGGRLLSTITPSGSGEYVQYHHPDRLGTRLITNSSDTTSFEQVTLPYGTALETESSGATNRRFTSYDRSSVTGLDYAVNRHYDSQQGRFTQVDPMGMGASSLSDPQSLNLYAYCGNDPVNHLDPDGLFWGKLKHFFSQVFKWLKVALAVALVVLAIISIGNPFVSGWAIAGAFMLAGALLASAFGSQTLRKIITVGLSAFAIYQSKPGIIWNWREGGGSGRLIPWLSFVGAIANFLQEAKKPNRNASDPTKLSDCVKELLAPWFKDLNLDRVMLLSGIPGYVPGNPHAYTEAYAIYFNKGELNQHTKLGIKLIAHELVHTRQYQRYGWTLFPIFVPLPIFGGLYGLDALRVKLGGGDPGGYANIYEKEAYDLEEKIGATLSNNPCPK